MQRLKGWGGGILREQRMVWEHEQQDDQILGPSKYAGVKERRALKGRCKANRYCQRLEKKLPQA